MRLFRPFLGGLACLVLTATARADAPPDPLRLVPEQADVFVEVSKPRQLVDAGLSNPLFAAVQALPPVRDLYDSTNARRFYQLVGYFEKELGANWPELLDQLAGGGIVLAVKFAPDPAPALLVIQGTDEKQMARFYKIGLDILTQELARQEAKEAIHKRSYKDVETIQVGNDFHIARAGAALLISNNEEVLHLALDRQRDGGKKSLAGLAAVKDSARLLPPHPLARIWLNLETIKTYPQAKEVFTSPRNDVNLTVLFGGLIDVATRSPYLCAGLYQEKNGYLATMRAPAGREGASADFALHAPPAKGPGLLPLLEPKGVVYSTSFYLDASTIWTERTKLFNEMQAKAIEEAGKNPGVRLVGLSPEKVLTQAGSRHRFVVVDQPHSAYKDAPAGQTIPAFAFITEMRNPDEFSRSMDAALRGAALLARGVFKLKIDEQKHGEYTIVGYRFPVNVKVEGDAGNLRFNFSPCFVRVKNQFVFCSTLELCHELVDLLDRESKTPASKGRLAAVQSRAYGSGGSSLLKAASDVLVTQTVLDQAITPDAAQEQIRALIDIVKKLGTVDTEEVYEAKQFRYDLRWKMGK